MATYTVGNADGTVFADSGTTSSGATGGAGSLSDALAQANATGEAVTINLVSDVKLSGPLSPIFNPSVTINGNGHTIDAGGTTRIFMVGMDQAAIDWANAHLAGRNTVILHHDGQATFNDPSGYAPYLKMPAMYTHRQQLALNDLNLRGGTALGGASGKGGGGLGAGGALLVNQLRRPRLQGGVRRRGRHAHLARAGHGLDVVQQFRVGGDGDDTLSFLVSNFGGSIAEVLHNTRQVRGVVITDPTAGDAVKLTGIIKAQLAHNRADFDFRA